MWLFYFLNAQMNLFIYLLYLFARYFFLPIKLFFLIVFRNLQGV